jgi:hypothetical protein
LSTIGHNTQFTYVIINNALRSNGKIKNFKNFKNFNKTDKPPDLTEKNEIAKKHTKKVYCRSSQKKKIKKTRADPTAASAQAPDPFLHNQDLCKIPNRA